MKKLTKLIISFLSIAVLSSNSCKKDYYAGNEYVRLSASLSDTAESIDLGDTLRVTLTIPNTVLTDSGQMVNVNTVQKGLYSFILYQLDTLTNRVTRIRNSASLSVSAGYIDSYLSYVSVTTANAPWESVLNIVPPAKGIYYIEIYDKGAFQVNGSFEAFLKLNFKVADIHDSIISQYCGADVGDAMLFSQNNGVGFYVFKVL